TDRKKESVSSCLWKKETRRASAYVVRRSTLLFLL
ncbi:hypothetical protein CSUI_007896, partial [Cystoisospora suis]